MLIELGKKVRDLVTGGEGIVTARVVYLNGCVQYCVVPAVDKDGKRRDGWYVDENQLKVVRGGLTATKVKKPAKPRRRSGGPSVTPPPTSYRGPK